MANSGENSNARHLECFSLIFKKRLSLYLGNLFFRNSLTANIGYLSQITDSLELFSRPFVIPYHIFSFFITFIYSSCLCVYVGGCALATWCMCAVVRGQLFKVRSSLPPSWFQGLNSGHLAWLQVPEPPGPSYHRLPEVLQNGFVFTCFLGECGRCLLCPFLAERMAF